MSALLQEWPDLSGHIDWIRGILVPLDGSPHATVALPVAKALAEMAGAALHIVHVGDYPVPPRERLQQLGVMSEYFEGAVLDQAAGEPAQTIARLAAERPGSVVVMCTHTGVEKPHRALGSVAEAVLCNAAVPVVLVQPERGQTAWRIRRILFPHDGTPNANAALIPANDLAQGAHAELMVLHVSGAFVARSAAQPGTLTAPRYIDQPQHEWPAWAHEFLARISGLAQRPTAPKLRLFLLAGDPANKIVSFTQEHELDLVVLTSYGHWDPGRAETLKMVIRYCGSPVLVLPSSWAPSPAA